MRNLAKHLPDSSGFDLKHILVEPGKPISLKKDFDPAYSGNFKDEESCKKQKKKNKGSSWLANSPNSANWEKAWPRLAERRWRFRLSLTGVFSAKPRDVGTAADQTS